VSRAAPPPGRLYCVPTPIAEGRLLADDLGPTALEAIARVDYVVAEHPKTARAFLKRLPLARALQEIEVAVLDEHTRDEAIAPLLAPVLAGRDAALVSEAGCPGVADPGARLVLAAHGAGIEVVPFVGPSALLLALMASGLNGQQFGFVGYVPASPAERISRLRDLEQRSRRNGETILMIETPYRNQALLDALLATLSPQTLLCVAAGLTGASQQIRTEPVADWRRSVANQSPLAKLPTVFLLLAR
jgi:16S rRNA (cytidine1402-2'-O)-methyltransferase